MWHQLVYYPHRRPEPPRYAGYHPHRRPALPRYAGYHPYLRPKVRRYAEVPPCMRYAQAQVRVRLTYSGARLGQAAQRLRHVRHAGGGYRWPGDIAVASQPSFGAELVVGDVLDCEEGRAEGVRHLQPYVKRL